MGRKDLPDRAQRIRQLLELHNQNSTDAFVNHALGLEYVNAGEIERGIHHFQMVITHHPDYVGTYYHLGKALENVDAKKAEQTYVDGMNAAKRVGDAHAWTELSTAAEALKESTGDA